MAAQPADKVGESTSGAPVDENPVREAVLSLGGASTVQTIGFHHPSAIDAGSMLAEVRPQDEDHSSKMH
jgi:hypothetical protein